MGKRNNDFSRPNVPKSKVNKPTAPKAKVDVPVPTVAAARKMEVMDEVRVSVPGIGEQYMETIFPGS